MYDSEVKVGLVGRIMIDLQINCTGEAEVKSYLKAIVKKLRASELEIVKVPTRSMSGV